MSGAVYELSNVLGTPYNGGNIAFTPNGQLLAMPSGNRLQLIELMSGNTMSLKPECYSSIRTTLIDPKNANYAILIDETGKAVIVNLVSQTKIGEFKFRDSVTCAAFSPCGNYIAIGLPRNVEIYQVPCPESHWQPKLLTRTLADNQKLECLSWCPDGQWIVTGGRDGLMRLIPVGQTVLSQLADSSEMIEDDNAEVVQYLASHWTRTFGDQAQRIRGVFVSADGKTLRSIGSNGKICSYQWKPEAAEKSGYDASRMSFTHKKNNANKKKRTMNQDDFFEQSKKEEEASFTAVGYPNYIKGHWTVIGSPLFASGNGSVTSAFQVPFRGTTGGCHKPKHQIWVIGFSGGSCTAYDSGPTDIINTEPPLDALLTLTVGDDTIDTISLSPDGERIAMASKGSGEMVVWEWRSETYVYKHTGHRGPVRCVAFSPSSEAGSKRTEDSRADLKANARSALGISSRSLAATGDEHGVVKLWDFELGQCIHTIEDHTAAVTAIAFTPQGNAFFTASLDGSVRAYDLARLRNFRTLVDPEFASQFTSLAIDATGEIVVATTQDGGAGDALLVWDIKTGRMLDRLNGHESQITQVAYDPSAGGGGQIATSSYDKTVRVWDLYGRAGKGDKATILQHTSEVMSLAYDPRSNGLLATSSLGGLIEFWDTQTGDSVGSIKADRDLYTAREAGSVRQATRGTGKKDKKGGYAPSDAFFSTIAYTPDGLSLIAGSEASSRICIYSTITRTMVYGIYITRNRSLDGVFRQLMTNQLTDSGYHKDELDVSDDDDLQDAEWRKNHEKTWKALPGVQSGALAHARAAKRLRIFQLDVSSDARSISVASSHGIFVYSAFNAQSALFSNAMSMRNQGLTNENFGIHLSHDADASIDGVYKLLIEKNYLKALRWALQLSDMKTLTTVYLSIPEAQIVPCVMALTLAENMAILNYLRLLLLPNAKQLVPNSEAGKVITSDGRTAVTAPATPVPHLHLHMSWLSAIMTSNLGTLLVKNSSIKLDDDIAGVPDYRTLFLLLLRSVQGSHTYLSQLYMPNIYEMKYFGSRKQQRIGEDQTTTKKQEK